MHELILNFLPTYLSDQVNDVSKSLSDGSTLPTLIEILAGESIPGIVDSRNLMQTQKLNNLVSSIEFLRSKGLTLPQVSILTCKLR